MTTISLESTMTNYLSLIERGNPLDASIQLTKAIRNVYFSDSHSWKEPLFKLMILSERKMFEDIQYRKVSVDRYKTVLMSRSENNNVFSNINTLILIKLNKEGMLDLTKDIAPLLLEETCLLSRGLWDTCLENFAIAQYSGSEDAYAKLVKVLNLMVLNVPEVNNIHDIVDANGSFQEAEAFILSLIEEKREENNKLVWGLAAMSIAFSYWYLGRMEEFRYLLMKIQQYLNETEQMYWVCKFLAKEFILECNED